SRWRFRPAMHQRLRDMSAFRIMMAIDTNSTQVTSWSQRTPSTALTGYITGMPVEHQMDLANTLGMDIWVTIPWRVVNPDEYAAGYAEIAAARLTNPDLKVILEWGNEPWNSGFQL